MIRAIDLIEAEQRNLAQFELQTKAELEQLERDSGAAQDSVGNAILGKGGHVDALNVLTGIHSSIEGKKMLLAALPKRKTDLDRELVEAQRIAFFASWAKIQKETWEFFDRLDTALKVLGRSADDFQKILLSGSPIAVRVGQDNEILWRKMEHFQDHLATALIDLEEARTRSQKPPDKIIITRLPILYSFHRMTANRKAARSSLGPGSQ